MFRSNRIILLHKNTRWLNQLLTLHHILMAILSILILLLRMRIEDIQVFFIFRRVYLEFRLILGLLRR